MLKNHSWTGIAHDRLYFFSVFRFVTMNAAMLASRFIFFEFALICSKGCVFNELSAIYTNAFLLMIGFTEQFNHSLYGLFFYFDSIFHKKKKLSQKLYFSSLRTK